MTKKFEDCHGLYDPMVVYMEQPGHGKQITKNFAGCHDPVGEYMENFCSGNGGLCVCKNINSIIITFCH